MLLSMVRIPRRNDQSAWRNVSGLYGVFIYEEKHSPLMSDIVSVTRWRCF